MFAKNNWDTASFAMHHPNNENSPWSEYFVDELEFGHAYNISQKVIMAGKVIYSLEARNNLGKLIDKFRPDIAHAHCIYHHLSPSILSLLHDNGIPTVMTAHDLKLACPAYKMLNSNGICEKCKHGNLLHLVKNRCIHNSLSISTLIAIESAFHKLSGLYSKNLDKFITPSLFFREKLIQWGWPEEKLVYIPNFLNSSNYTPNYNPGNYFLYFGRLAPEKGVDTLIRATALAGVKLKIAGTGPYEDRLRSISAENGADVTFLGYCSGDTLWELIRSCRAVVLPSQWYENAPISILEAYASGKPVLGAQIGGIPEMINENTTGFLYTSGDVNELSNLLDKINRLSVSDIQALGREARSHVERNSSEELYLNRMLDLYNSINPAIYS